MGSLYADVVPYRRRWTDHDRWIRDRRPNGDFLWWHVGPEAHNDWNLWTVWECRWPQWVPGQLAPVQPFHLVFWFSGMYYGIYVHR